MKNIIRIFFICSRADIKIDCRGLSKVYHQGFISKKLSWHIFNSLVTQRDLEKSKIVFNFSVVVYQSLSINYCLCFL